MKKLILTLIFVFTMSSSNLIEASLNKTIMDQDCFQLAWEAYGEAEAVGATKEEASYYADLVYDICELENWFANNQPEAMT